MANESKRKGTAWETSVRDFINEATGKYLPLVEGEPRQFADSADPHNCKRQTQQGRYDVGDLHAWPVVIECKAEKRITLPEYVRQANAEAVNAGMPFGVAVVKAPRKNVKDGYVVTDLATFVRILRALREAPPNP
ncbi:hypothetical protein [Kitasatospora sp. NPDC088346]|uniref:hypothetical protein n=1 Tax=Kitasatospora sp. NPDC088346 TaxID=3364073 RepID=UPI0038059E12